MKVKGFILLLSFSCVFLAPPRAEGQVGKAAAYVAKSKAAQAFGGILVGYLFGKGMDKLFDTLGQPDPTEIDRSLLKLQTDHPEFRQLFGSIRRSIGPSTDRAAFESICLDAIEQFDRAQIKSALNPAGVKAAELPATGLSLNREWLLQPRAGLNDPFLSDWRKNRPLLPDATTPISEWLARRNGLEFTPLAVSTPPALVGAWSFDYDGSHQGYGDCYLFFPDGKVTRYQALRDEVFAFYGTYTQNGARLTIRWESRFEESGNVSLLKDGHLKFQIASASATETTPAEFHLTRISDVGTFSAVYIRNLTGSPIKFTLRWASTDGTWTPWIRHEIEPDGAFKLSQVGGFYCLINFDASFEEGYQETQYALPFAVASNREAAPDSPDRNYNFRAENDRVELTTQKLK